MVAMMTMVANANAHLGITVSAAEAKVNGDAGAAAWRSHLPLGATLATFGRAGSRLITFKHHAANFMR